MRYVPYVTHSPGVSSRPNNAISPVFLLLKKNLEKSGFQRKQKIHEKKEISFQI